LTVRDFCLDHDLTESAFYFWRRVVAERDRKVGSSNTPAFVPITVVQAPVALSNSPIDIHLKGGSRLRVRSGCDRELLAAVLTLLEGRSC
jgi:transposase-like protein